MNEDMTNQIEEISLWSLVARFRWQILTTWFLVFLEAGLMLTFPLAIGIAVDGLIQQSYDGLYLLGEIGGLTIFAGAARRCFDTRLYSRIFTIVAGQIVTQERANGASVSVVAARTNMAKELVEFLENSFPAIIDCGIGLIGTLIMVWWLQAHVFVACLVATTIIFAVYALTSNRTFTLNQGANDESEKSVAVLGDGSTPEIATHFRQLMQWNIRLSDLETVTFSLSWLVMIAVLLFSVVATVHSGVTAHGKILSILMYVFGYVESVTTLPLFYQQFVRLQEISTRL